MNRISSFVLIVPLMLLLGRGQAVAEPILRGAAETFPPDGHCLDTRLPDAHCASVFIDPDTGSEIRTESVFHAEYGYLHGRSASEVKNWHPLLGMPQGGQAYGFFADFLTFSGPRRVGYAEILWDWGSTGIGQSPFLLLQPTIASDGRFRRQ
jgi:hypothetical protein